MPLGVHRYHHLGAALLSVAQPLEGEGGTLLEGH